MKGIEQLVSTLKHIGEHAETLKSLQQQVERMEKTIEELKKQSNGGWVTLAKAANEVGLTASALRQKVKNKINPLEEDLVWKQENTNASIYINLKELGRYL